eukprot:TRINITY_DN22832_c0_g1_i2.p1 TRINITY_DN22832_c0_g1~~TRINITY_DN22832_c0_g1_i2.p1  ORF type:complete len:232 (-),score=47.39 TRINITY_DN22832_c0_g1_i2:37-732(-)
MVELTMALAGNVIGGEGLLELFEGIGNLKQLRTLRLELSETKAGHDGARGIGTLLSQLEALEDVELNLWRNFVGYHGALGLAEGLVEMENLQSLELNLGSNFLGKEGSFLIFQALTQIQSLRALNLDLHENNFIDDSATEAIAPLLSGWSGLQSLELYLLGNEVSGRGVALLSTSITKSCPSLQTLSFDLNPKLQASPPANRSKEISLAQTKKSKSSSRCLLYTSPSPRDS